MDFGESLVNIRKEKGISRKDFAERLQIPYTTLRNYETNQREPGHQLLIKMATILGVSVDTLIGHRPVTQKAPSLSDEAKKVAERYTKLDRFGKAAVQAVMGEEEARIKEQAELELTLSKPEPRVIPLYWSAAAAGIAAPILGDDYDHYELTPEDPQGAMFAIKVQGDSMEPYFPDGSIAFCNKDPISDGDIGVFCLDGESFIKQYHYDRFMGMTYLFSLNRDRANADKLITRSSGQYLNCLGRVITRQKYPLPV